MPRCRARRRRVAFSLIELLIVVAILAALVGVAVPFFQDNIREARKAKLAAQFDVVRKAMDRAVHDQGLVGPSIPGAYGLHRLAYEPDREIPVKALVPQYLQEIPRDPWGGEIYRFGNYLVSNGPEQAPDPATVIAVPLFDARNILDPTSKNVLVRGDFQMARHQMRVHAWRLHQYVTLGGRPLPPSMGHFYGVLGQASPLDPWDAPYQLAPAIIQTFGENGVPGGGDDYNLGWTPITSGLFRFRKGMLRFDLVHPVGKTARALPLLWDEPNRKGIVTKMAQDDGRQAYWARLLPEHVPWKGATAFRVRFDLRVRRIAGSVTVGVISHYDGPGTGYAVEAAFSDTTKLVTLSTDPPIGRGKTLASNALSGGPLGAGTWTSMTVQVELTAGGRLLGQVNGAGGGGSLNGGVLPPEMVREVGAFGFFVRALERSSEFQVEVTEITWALL